MMIKLYLFSVLRSGRINQEIKCLLWYSPYLSEIAKDFNEVIHIVALERPLVCLYLNTKQEILSKSIYVLGTKSYLFF